MNEYDVIAPFYDFMMRPFIRGVRRKVLDTVLRLKLGKVLDVCCGTGDQLRLLKQNDIEAMGIDLSESMLRISQKGRHAPNCLLQKASAMAFKTESFDLAMISFALHETGWKAAEAILEESYRILKPSGHLLVVDYADFSGPSFLVKMLIRLIESGAGKRHYRNFREYHEHGGLNALIAKCPFMPVSEEFCAFKSIVLKLCQKVNGGRGNGNLY